MDWSKIFFSKKKDDNLCFLYKKLCVLVCTTISDSLYNFFVSPCIIRSILNFNICILNREPSCSRNLERYTSCLVVNLKTNLFQKPFLFGMGILRKLLFRINHKKANLYLLPPFSFSSRDVEFYCENWFLFETIL